MAKQQEILVPDIGDFDDVPVIEILVSEGDRVAAEDPLITLESDKATMDVPAPQAGVIRSIKVKVGDSVSEGTAIMVLEVDAGEQADAQPEAAGGSARAGGGSDAAGRGAASSAAPDGGPGSAKAEGAQPAAEKSAAASGGGKLEVKVPDIGDFSDIPVIEILVSVGDQVAAETPLVTLESDKATMDVPAPQAGAIESILVKVGDTVSEGTAIMVLAGASGGAGAADSAGEDAGAAGRSAPAAEQPAPEREAPGGDPAPRHPGASAPDPRAPVSRASPTAAMSEAEHERATRPASHATPAMRRLARDLGVDLRAVTGTGRKGRILEDDIKRYIKGELTKPREAAAGQAAAGGSGIPPIPTVDFGKFGEIETVALSRIKKISGAHLHRAWLNVPHVTHHDEADITELEAFRKSLKAEAEKQGVRVTPLVFMMKALVSCLKRFPTFNASLASDGQSLVMKKYFHIGVAVDTPNGLVVPVFRDVDKKGVMHLARELGEVSLRARDGKLKPDEMQGGCMSISSLGGIGGTAFTPIVNAPEVAILGVTRSRMTPVWNGKDFEPRLMLPLDLSYDHRVVDGAEAARFVAHLATVLGDVRRLLL